jgi:hypothetical protein
VHYEFFYENLSLLTEFFFSFFDGNLFSNHPIFMLIHLCFQWFRLTDLICQWIMAKIEFAHTYFMFIGPIKMIMPGKTGTGG